MDFCLKAQNLEVFSNIQDQNLKIKTYSDWCPYQGLSNGTTLMQIQSGQTVTFKVIFFYTCETFFCTV
jgi:hypothetical protein